MKRTYHFLLPLLSLFLVRVDLTDLIPLKMSFKSLEVLDGDTVLIARGRNSYRVRLLYIDAPEKGQMAGNLDLGEYSRHCLRAMSHQAQMLKIVGIDLYQRVLGEIDDLSYRMVAEGCAYLYEYSKFSTRAQRTRFLLAQNRAQRLRLGLWKFKVLNPRLYRKQRLKSQ